MSPSFLDRFKRYFHSSLIALVSLLLATLISMSCGGASTGTSSSQLVISPNGLNLVSGETQQFTATILNTSNPGVTWSASSGTISADGLFTAPTVATNTRVLVSAASVEDGSKTASATLMIEPSGTLRITTTALPTGAVGSPYESTLTASGGVPPYRWSVRGSLPSGLMLHAANGTITGTPTITGSYSIPAIVTDTKASSASQSVNVVLTGGNSKLGYDGPAELPRVYIQSTLSDTPALGTVISVPAGGNFQTALEKASCGDTVQLQAGATYSGVFTFPAKPCDDNHWIVIRTSAPDSALPQEGSRLTPCYAGVSSLPGRPPLNCSSTANVMAKLEMNSSSAEGPVVFAPGANHYRFLGLEITRRTGTPVVDSLASVQVDGTVDRIVFDRVWMHGTAQDETTRAIALGGGTYISVVDSYFTDFHCTSVTGSCTDAQAISGGLGSNPMGPYKIVDNFLEAAGENILFGGGAATVAPTDIEIRHNHFFKPLTWMRGQAGFVGGTRGNPFIVKNLLELKNAQRVLIDGNLMENSWGGFSQVGFAVLLTPKNQAAGGGGNICPGCQVTDVTIRNGVIRHVGAGMQIANGLSDNGGAALAGARYSVHDVIVDDIDGVKYDGPGEFAQISMGAGAAVLEDVTINHITAFPPSVLLNIGDQTNINPQMKSFVFTNSIVNAGTYPVWSTGGGSTNCASHNLPVITFHACFDPYVFASNAIIASPSGSPPAKWPLRNFFPAATSAVRFVNYNGGDYHLTNSSPFKGAGTDGKDLGADVDAIESATTAVE